MVRVDFYVLTGNNQRERYACSVANKAWQNGNRVFIQVQDPDAASMLDDLLWTYNDISFVPHAQVTNGADDLTPVLIGCSEMPQDCQVVINLTQAMPLETGRIERIVEIVSNDEAVKTPARERYREYRSQGYEIHDHIIDQS